jgi:hypothetical protein
MTASVTKTFSLQLNTCPTTLSFHAMHTTHTKDFKWIESDLQCICFIYAHHKITQSSSLNHILTKFIQIDSCACIHQWNLDQNISLKICTYRIFVPITSAQNCTLKSTQGDKPTVEYRWDKPGGLDGLRGVGCCRWFCGWLLHHNWPPKSPKFEPTAMHSPPLTPKIKDSNPQPCTTTTIDPKKGVLPRNSRLFRPFQGKIDRRFHALTAFLYAFNGSLGATAIGQSRVFITYDINQIRVFFAVNFMYLSIRLYIWGCRTIDYHVPLVEKRYFLQMIMPKNLVQNTSPTKSGWF